MSSKPITLEAALADPFPGWRYTSTGPLMDFTAAYHVRAALQAVAARRIVTPTMEALARIEPKPMYMSRDVFCPDCWINLSPGQWHDPAEHCDHCEWVHARRAIEALDEADS